MKFAEDSHSSLFLNKELWDILQILSDLNPLWIFVVEALYYLNDFSQGILVFSFLA